MQQYYRIALGMCLLIGFLQAKPLMSFINKDNLWIDPQENVSCNMNFTTPKDWKKPCHGDALIRLRNSWEVAKDNCDSAPIEQIWETLNAVPNVKPQPNCTPTMIVHEQFASFLNATTDFVQEWNSIIAQE